MATTEETNAASNPTYAEMILAAITALGEKNGSNQSAITKYIETTYAGTLREGYAEEISEALTRFREGGELLFTNELYIKLDPNSPARRGRGRPKKLERTVPPGTLSPTPNQTQKDSQSSAVNAAGGIPRRRGRPPKPKDSLSNAVKAAGGSPRRRGRPPKPKDSNAVKIAGGTPRSRGRPAKPKDSNVAAVKTAGETPRSRGRPRKDSNAAAVKTAGGIPRSRGRPPKRKDFNVAAVKTFVVGTPRSRGRPAKRKDFNGAAVKTVVVGTPRSRGRPAKRKDFNVAAVKIIGQTLRSRGRPPKKHLPVVSSGTRAVEKGNATAPGVSGVKRGRGRPPKLKPSVAAE